MKIPEGSTPKRVLHILVTLNLGGAESRTMDLFRNQDPAVLRHDFLVMTEEPGHFSEEVLANGGQIHVVRNPRQHLFGHIIDLYRLFKTHPQYDAVHAHTSFHAGLCLLIAKVAGIKARISHARNVNTSTPSAFFKMMLRLGRALINTNATTRFASSQAAGDYLYGENSSFQVIPDAFNYHEVAHKSDVAAQQKPLLIDNGGINFVAVARFYPVKNHRFMVDVLKEMVALRDDVFLHFIGDGELKQEIETYVESLGLTKNVVFWGKRDDVYRILPFFDIMLMPSITEGLGGAALEAQKAGLPCLLSDTIPSEADLALGLCTKLPLSLPAKSWAETGLGLIDTDIPSKSTLDEAFEAKGFSLAYSERVFYEAYSAHE